MTTASNGAASPREASAEPANVEALLNSDAWRERVEKARAQREALLAQQTPAGQTPVQPAIIRPAPWEHGGAAPTNEGRAVRIPGRVPFPVPNTRRADPDFNAKGVLADQSRAGAPLKVARPEPMPLVRQAEAVAPEPRRKMTAGFIIGALAVGIAAGIAAISLIRFVSNPETLGVEQPAVAAAPAVVPDVVAAPAAVHADAAADTAADTAAEAPAAPVIAAAPQVAAPVAATPDVSAAAPELAMEPDPAPEPAAAPMTPAEADPVIAAAPVITAVDLPEMTAAEDGDLSDGPATFAEASPATARPQASVSPANDALPLVPEPVALAPVPVPSVPELVWGNADDSVALVTPMPAAPAREAFATLDALPLVAPAADGPATVSLDSVTPVARPQSILAQFALSEVAVVHVHAPPSVAEADLATAMAAITETGVRTDDARRVPYTIKETQVRFYHAADAEAAAALAEVTGGPARDFTATTPAPPQGTLEVWLAGTAPKAAKAKVARKAPTNSAPAISPEEQQKRMLRDQLILQLRRGDHL